MLRYLKVSNLAIIDRVEVEFGRGFNVVTGETGAGKSILIGALNLLLGSRFSPDMIRTGEDEAQVEALFELPAGYISQQELACDPDGTGDLILARKILRSGKSRCFAGGHLVPLSALGAMGRSLVSIFGQHEHQVLLDSEEHVEILDQFGSLGEERRKTASAWSAWSKAKGEIVAAVKRLEDLERRNKENAEAVEELSAAALKVGEEEALVQEREGLRNAVQIREKAFEAHHALYSRTGSLLSGLADVKRAADFLASANPGFAGLRDNLQEAIYQLDDVALELREIAEKFHADPGRLERIEERLAQIRRLKRKYGRDLEGLIELVEVLDRDQGDVLQARSAVKNLTERVEKGRESYLSAARSLSQARKEVAGKLESSMKHELTELAMPFASFSVSFSEISAESASPAGLERVEFFLASNPGEAARPLAKIASGGELSRIMLALKALQTGDRGAGTVIFDEVDAGIGGVTASAVGARLARVAKSRQVLCVTHLHQIAALADHHLSVKKTVSKGRTRIGVKALAREDRVDELARMLGATGESDSVKDHVRNLMDRASAEVVS